MTKRQYEPDNWKVQCDICGRSKRRTECRMQWDGLLVCADRCYSPKHPNEYPRQVPNDGLPVPDARPRPSMEHRTFIPVGGFIRWEDQGLTWETPTWYWEDDLSQVSLSDILASGNI